MIYHKTLKSIRRHYGLTPEDLSEKTGYYVPYINAIEDPKNEVPATPEFVQALRDALGLEDAPITENERGELLGRLEKWKAMIDYGDMDRAAKLKQKLEYDTRRSFSTSTQLMLELFTASYYRAIEDFDACYKLMDALSLRKDEFNAKHFYFYHRLVGVRAFTEGRFRDAVNALTKAEKMERQLRREEVGFYYLYGACLSDMGYVANAIENLRKAKYFATWKKVYNGQPNSRFDCYIDGYLAYNLGMIGRNIEAFRILHKRLRIEKESGNKETIGFTYHSIGSVYMVMKQYDEAVINFDVALENLCKKRDAYKSALCRKALSLLRSGKESECVSCVEKGLSVCSESDIVWRAMLLGLKYSATLHDNESVIRLENEAIRILTDYGYQDAVDFYEILYDFFMRTGDKDRALKYSALGMKAYKRLYEERMEGGMRNEA